ncbi:ribosomal large subunit pseudouridine synthase B [Lutibacter oricola]|uniref:Pseudouridine synthase n=1 Tax=Lutibacter oricola TaxID=762486 RepID=A0A1H2UB05_9FLAO|nr:pseudouridine synthase [Lutibacter oricola]SDW53137.1 ribosomal large subunit pseudouridine synthase B [Lutibacter oricola]
MNSNKNSSRGRQQGKKNPQKSTNRKFDDKRKSSSSSSEGGHKRPFKRDYETSNTSKRKFDNKGKFSKPSKPAAPKQEKSENEGIRLNKYIANAGICSRREADVFIAAGSATVNGKVVSEMGYKVMTTDVVRFDNVLISPEKKQYILLNKPKNFITTMEDDRGRRTVMELVSNATKERIYPVGRLDRNTTGLLLFTNDGELAKKLTHPKHNIQKIYHASLDKKLAMSDLHKISDGFMLDERRVLVDDISYIENQPKSEVGVKIHSGRNRIVRRIFEHFNYAVVKLDRVIFAGLTKKNLPRGHWRHLTEMEVNNLKML